MKIQDYIEAAKRSAEWHKDYIQKMKKCRFDTIAVHGIYSMEEALDFNQGSIIEPAYLSTSQTYRDSNEMEAALSYQIPTWCYARIATPTIYYLEGVLSLLETYGTDIEAGCCVTSSGMSAIQSAIEPFLVSDKNLPGKPINFVASCQVYGGTYQLFSVRKEMERNIEWRRVINSNDNNEWETKIDENTRFLYGEMPSNPTLGFFDLEKVANLAHKHNLPLIIDSTIATPALLRPLAHGADIVVHSVTKSMSSSGFGVSGAIIAKKNLTSNINNDQLKEDFCTYVKLLPNRDTGPNTTPMNALFALNDIRTLRTRMEHLSRNTMKVARFLEGHKRIEAVEYLGLPSHPLYQIASKYMYLVDSELDSEDGKKMNRYSHLMSFRIKGSHEDTRKVFDALQRIWRATDLGRIKSVATIPAISTHAQQGEEGRKLAAIPANLIRLCVGAEHPDDIIADLDQALAIFDRVDINRPGPEFSVGGASSASLRDE